MNEKPILFSTLMVKALLNTKPNTYPPEPINLSKPCKGMTRLVVKPQPKPLATSENLIIENGKLKKTWRGEMMIWQTEIIGKPKYQAGDVLWVQETWSTSGISDDGYGLPERRIIYKANGTFNDIWNPSIHMPREAARLFLKVRGVRVERLQDITQGDATKEGIQQRSCGEVIMNIDIGVTQTLIHDFRLLWDNLNAKRGYGWGTNPYVWVYEFERVEK